jgi:hypothetical protein
MIMDIVAWVVVWLVCLLLDSKIMGPNPAKAMDFKCNKNPHHTFLRMGSKAGGPMSRFYGRHVKKPLASVNKMLARPNPHFFCPFLLLAPRKIFW